MPHKLFEISDTPPHDPRNWQDESAYLSEFSTSRGKADELEQSQAGSMTALVDNMDGHYADLLPMRSVRMSVQSDTGVSGFTMRSSHLGTTTPLRSGTMQYSLFSGFNERTPQTWPDPSDSLAHVSLQATDGFGAMADADFLWGHRYETADPESSDWPCGVPSGTNVTPDNGPPFIPDESAASRITRVLDCLEWPADDRELDTGLTILGSADTFAGTANFRVTDKGVSHMQSVALTDGGRVFIDAAGKVRFIDADNLPTAPNPTEIFGDVPGEIRYETIVVERDVDRLWNQITVNSTESSEISAQTAEDATSIEEFGFGPRPKAFTVLPIDPAVMGDRADEMLARYKDPTRRVTGLKLVWQNENDFRKIISHEIGDVVRVRRRPPSGGTYEWDVRIESIAITARALDDWQITWQLSVLAETFEAGGGGEGFDSGTFDSSTFGA